MKRSGFIACPGQTSGGISLIDAIYSIVHLFKSHSVTTRAISDTFYRLGFPLRSKLIATNFNREIAQLNSVYLPSDGQYLPLHNGGDKVGLFLSRFQVKAEGVFDNK